MSRHRYKKSKFEAEKLHISTTVLRIEEQNILVNDKFKTVFYCESNTNPKGQMCIAWGKTRIIEGSRLEMNGRFKDGVFLVWSMKITNSKVLPPQENMHTNLIKEKLKELRTLVTKKYF